MPGSKLLEGGELLQVLALFQDYADVQLLIAGKRKYGRLVPLFIRCLKLEDKSHLRRLVLPFKTGDYETIRNMYYT